MNVRLDELKPGDEVEVVGFDCMDGIRVIETCEHGLFVRCSMGRHYLDGQLDDDGTLVGIFPPTA